MHKTLEHYFSNLRTTNLAIGAQAGDSNYNISLCRKEHNCSSFCEYEENLKISSAGMWLCVAAVTCSHVGSPLADFSTLKMETIRTRETSVNARSTQRHIPEHDILHSHFCENFKSYTMRKIS
jgi:hypothetical protein